MTHSTARRPRSSTSGAGLLGLGGYLPAREVCNAELALLLGTSDQWIRSRVGVVTRRYAAEETVADMAVAAGGKALAAAGLTGRDVDLVLLATCTLPSAIPARAPQVAARLDGTGAAAVDVNAGCAGFVYALGLAAQAVRAGDARHVLVVASERLTDIVDRTDRRTAVIFGDGAGAAVVGQAAANGIGSPVWGSDGSRAELIRVSAADPYLRMDGPAVYRWATELAPLALRACARAGVAPRQLAAFVPHQANLRIVDSLARALGAPRAVVARDVVDTGNTGAVSIPLALSRLVESGRVGTGDPVLLFAFGAGLSYAGTVARCP